MMEQPDSKPTIEALIRPCLQTAILDSHQGGTAAQVFVLYDVFKVGAPAYIDSEYGIYHDLQSRLGDDLYREIFPQVVLRQRNTNQALLEMTWLGSSTTEQILAPLSQGEWSPILASWPDASPILEKLSLVDQAVERTLEYLDMMFKATRIDVSDTALAFTAEALAAIRVNLRQAGLLPDLEAAMSALEKASEFWAQGLAISCCHRDLMVGHIYIQSTGNGLVVRLADPKSAVPRLDETPAGLERRPSSLGCAAVDLAHLEVSLYRRQLELQHVNPVVRLDALERVHASAEEWIGHNRFSRAFYALSKAVYLSGYASCRCNYCLAPQRLWLYDQMLADCKALIFQCAELAEKQVSL